MTWSLCQWIPTHLRMGVILCDKVIQICCCSVISSVQFFADPTDFITPCCSVLSLLKFMSIESVIVSNHLILCCPLLLLPSVFPSIRIFSNEFAVHYNFSLDILCPFSANYCSKQMKSFINASLVLEPRMRSSTYYKRTGFLGNWQVLRSWGNTWEKWERPQ